MILCYKCEDLLIRIACWSQNFIQFVLIIINEHYHFVVHAFWKMHMNHGLVSHGDCVVVARVRGQK